MLARDGLVLDHDVARVESPDHDARLARQRDRAHAAGGADDEPRLACALAHGLDVGRLVEFRSAGSVHGFGSDAGGEAGAVRACLVWAARPASFFLPRDIAGHVVDAPHDVTAELARLVLERSQAVVVADVLRRTSPSRGRCCRSRRRRRLRIDLHVTALGARGIAALGLRRPAADRGARGACGQHESDGESEPHAVILPGFREAWDRSGVRRKGRRARRALRPEHSALGAILGDRDRRSAARSVAEARRVDARRRRANRRRRAR